MIEEDIYIKNKIQNGFIYTIKPFNKDKRKTQPHKHVQYLEIVFLQTGSGFHWIDDNIYIINSPVMFFIKSHQTHYWDIKTEPSGYVIILKDIFPNYSDDICLKQLLNKIRTINCFYLEGHHELKINLLFELLSNSANKGLHYEPLIIDGLLKALFAIIVPITLTSDNGNTRYIELYYKFIDLLYSDSNEYQDISVVADALKVSPQRLNAACRRAVNLSTGMIIDEFIMNKAKQLLLFTSLTICEISLKLNFKNSSYFIRFFKKYQKTTPEKFKKNHFLFTSYK